MRAVGKVFSLRIMEHRLCLGQLYECLFQSLYIFNQVGHSSVFVETCEAHTLLGTVTQLINPASVHLGTSTIQTDSE